MEPTAGAQEAWVEHVADVAKDSLMGKANSWYVGANIPGKPRVVMPYTGGQPVYRERCDEVVKRVDALNLPSYTGFVMPQLTAVTGADGKITDLTISYPMDLTKQMLEYSGVRK